jgi:hypothetical protein
VFQNRRGVKSGAWWIVHALPTAKDS